MQPDRKDTHEQYVSSVAKEWEWRKPQLKNRTITSIYFGGGTPSLLSPNELEALLKPIDFDRKIEVTLEANPELLTPEKLKAFRALGINRLSIGAQSFDDQLLKALERTHTAKETLKAIDLCVNAGFDNLSIDLMYDLPSQTEQQWHETLNITSQLPITHLSLYNLQIEEGSAFFKRQKSIQPLMPKDEVSLKMYEDAFHTLTKAGLAPYEISAFAKNNLYSRHNTGYWTGRSFLGYGPSAFSYDNGVRFQNVAHFNKYAKALNEGKDPADFHDILDPNARRRELLAIELRLLQGVNLAQFQHRHGPLETETLDAITHLQNDGLLEKQTPRLQLTNKGILFYDSVASEII